MVAAPLALSACGGPIELTVAKLAGDLISYVSTGKSTTDHAVSFVAEQDCALHRPLLEQDICKDEETVLAEEAAALAVMGEPEIKQEIRAARPEILLKITYEKHGYLLIGSATGPPVKQANMSLFDVEFV